MTDDKVQKLYNKLQILVSSLLFYIIKWKPISEDDCFKNAQYRGATKMFLMCFSSVSFLREFGYIKLRGRAYNEVIPTV